MIDKNTAKEIALSCGFKLKQQENGEMDLNPYVYDTINKAIEFYESQKNGGWTSIDDALPPQDIDLLLYHPKMGKAVKGCYAVDNSPFTDDDGKEYACSHWFEDEYGSFAWEIDEISHWQYLPQPPKE